jgi:hypothetical protein
MAKRLVLRPGIAAAEKVSQLNERAFTSGWLVGVMKNKHALAFATEKPSVAVCATVNLSFLTHHASPCKDHNKPPENLFLKRPNPPM